MSETRTTYAIAGSSATTYGSITWSQLSHKFEESGRAREHVRVNRLLMCVLGGGVAMRTNSSILSDGVRLCRSRPRRCCVREQRNARGEGIFRLPPDQPLARHMAHPRERARGHLDLQSPSFRAGVVGSSVIVFTVPEYKLCNGNGKDLCVKTCNGPYQYCTRHAKTLPPTV